MVKNLPTKRKRECGNEGAFLIGMPTYQWPFKERCLLEDAIPTFIHLLP